MNDNIYVTPQAELVENSTLSDSINIASRRRRFFAAMIDAMLLTILFTLPAMFLFGWFDLVMQGKQPSMGMQFAFNLGGMVFFLLMNGVFLVRNGQSIGKIALGIRIEDLEGNLIPLPQLILKRYSVYWLPSMVPFVGGVLSLINICFIFGKEKRCLHDYVASSRVVRC